MYSLQINLLLLKPLLLASDPESTVFPCARPPLDQVRSLFLFLFILLYPSLFMFHGLTQPIFQLHYSENLHM